MRFDGLWLVNKKMNKQIAVLTIILLLGEAFINAFTFAGMGKLIGYHSPLFRIVLVLFLAWLGAGLWRRKLAAV